MRGEAESVLGDFAVPRAQSIPDGGGGGGYAAGDPDRSPRLGARMARMEAHVHYPTCKAWLYLNDIDERNGAFIFCKGSQKMTPARLAYEYEASIRVARNRHTSSNNGLLRKPTQRQISAMKLRETSMCGKANTLLIANTQGFHRMGEFSDERPREKIYICFRDVESAQNRRTPKAR